MQKPTILIIAGGNNSRFFPLNTKTHKGFIELLGKPLIIRAIENARAHGFQEIVIVASRRDFDSDEITTMLSHYEQQKDVTILVQKEAKGMADAVLTAKHHLSDHFILASPYYTNIGEIADQLWQTKSTTGADCVLLASESIDPSIEGIMKLDGNRVLGVIEKPKPEEAPSNIRIRSTYLFNQDFLHQLQQTAQQEYALETAYDLHCKNAHYSFVKTDTELPTLKYAWHLHNMFSYLIRQQKTLISDQATIAQTAIIDDSKGPVIIEAGATIGHAAKVVGPCYIGRNAMVGDYCFVRGGCSLEENAVVGSNTEVVRSLILKKATIHYGYIADSILGNNTKVGAGLITANKRLDRKNIKVTLKGKRVDSGTNSFGIITGENTNFGIRTSTMPGVLIGADSAVYPGKVLFENVEHGETVK